MKRKQMLALCMAAVLTVSMSAGTVSFAEEMDPVQQDAVEREMTEDENHRSKTGEDFRSPARAV